MCPGEQGLSPILVPFAHQQSMNYQFSGRINQVATTADRDLLLEQGSGSRRGEAELASFALGTQEAIRCGRAHGKQLAPALLGEVEMLMPFQRYDKRGKKRDEAFILGQRMVDTYWL